MTQLFVMNSQYGTEGVYTEHVWLLIFDSEGMSFCVTAAPAFFFCLKLTAAAASIARASAFLYAPPVHFFPVCEVVFWLP